MPVMEWIHLIGLNLTICYFIDFILLSIDADRKPLSWCVMGTYSMVETIPKAVVCITLVLDCR